MKAINPKTTLSRERWLEMALTAMETHCVSKFTLDSLLQVMPVSKGSFYFHFKDRADFLTAIAKFWFRNSTKTVIDELSELPADVPPQRKLWELMCRIKDLNTGRWELLIRALALEFPEVNEIVAQCDQVRNQQVMAIFAEIGFEGKELEMRTFSFQTTYSLGTLLDLGMNQDDYDALLERQFDFFIRE